MLTSRGRATPDLIVTCCGIASHTHVASIRVARRGKRVAPGVARGHIVQLDKVCRLRRRKQAAIGGVPQ